MLYIFIVTVRHNLLVHVSKKHFVTLPRSDRAFIEAKDCQLVSKQLPVQFVRWRV